MIKKMASFGVVGLLLIAVHMAPAPAQAQQEVPPKEPEYCEVIPSEEQFYEDDCVFQERLAELVVTITPATCQQGEVLNYETTNAYIDESSTAAGTEGPVEYTVTAFAFEGARFAEAEGVYEGGYVQTTDGELSGPLSAEACTVVTPAVPQSTAPLLPETSAASPFLVIAVSVISTIGLVAIAIGIRSALGRSL